MKKKWIWILLLTVVFCVTVVYANYFVGNPISEALVNRAAQKYVAEQYGDLQLEVYSAQHGLCSNTYYVYAKSAVSKDSRFSMSFSPFGILQEDQYDVIVRGGYNAWQRVDDAYRNMIDHAGCWMEFSFDCDGLMGDILGTEAGFTPFQMDCEYDTLTAAKERGHLTLSCITTDLTEAKLAQVLSEVKMQFDEEEMPFYSIDITLHDADKSIALFNFPYAEINTQEMMQRIQQTVQK